MGERSKRPVGHFRTISTVRYQQHQLVFSPRFVLMVVAGQYFKAHRTVFGPDDELVKQAKTGDRVVIWARAQYPVRPPQVDTVNIIGHH